MLLIAALAPFFVLAARVVADANATTNSPISLPIAKNFGVTGPINPGQRERRRRSLVKGAQKRDSSNSPGVANVPLNDDGVYYSASIGVGSPATFYTLIVDLASANTWVGANKSRPYKTTSTSVKTSDFLNMSYSGGAITAFGNEYLDTVTIASCVDISRQSIGAVTNTTNFPSPYDGLIGIGPNDMTIGTLYPDNTTVIPTVTDNLFQQGKIQRNLIALSLEPVTSGVNVNGEISFGAINATKYTGPLNFFPRTKTAPPSTFWGADASFRYGNNDDSGTVLNTSAGVFDIGYYGIGLAPYAYNKYVEETGALLDNSTGFLRISPTNYQNLKSLFFVIGGISYELNPNAQTWPRKLNNLIGGDADGIYLVVDSVGEELYEVKKTGFVAGSPFLERFYSVYDSADGSIGLAQTQFTYADTN